DAVQHLVKRITGKILRRTPNTLDAVPRPAEDAALSEPALHERREPDTAPPRRVSCKERRPVRTGPRTLRHEHTLAAPHRHELVITITHPRHARQNAATRKPGRQSHGRKLSRAQLLSDLVEVADQRLIDDRLNNKLDRGLSRSLNSLPRR